jgi:penicillin amidase
MNWFFILAIAVPPTLMVLLHVLRTLPEYSDSSLKHGTFDKVTLTRSSQGVPQITCESLDDLFFALGYVHAQDRLWQMDILRRRAEGSLSAFLGPEHISSDIFSRNMRFKHQAESLSHLSPKGQYLLKRYAQGINSYAEHSYLPVEYFLTWNKWRRWTMGDSLTIWRFLSFFIGNNLQNDLLRSEIVKVFGSSLNIMPSENEKLFETYFSIESHELPGKLYKENFFNYPAEDGVAFDEFQDVFKPFPMTSNLFVVSGEFTRSGLPVLANDFSFLNEIPAVIYLVQGKWLQEKVSGGTIPGFPVFLFANNNKISWGVSAVHSRSLDLYTNITENHNTKQITEEISVRNGKSVKIYFNCGSFGCSLHSNPSVFIRWAADETDDKTFDGYLDLLTSYSVRSIRKSLEKIIIPQFNFLFATAEGDIGYQVTGAHPLREQVHLGVVDFGKTQHLWKDFIEFEELPHVVNPNKGYIINSNNFPTTSIYKHFQTFGKEFSSSRAARIDDLLQNLIKKRIKVTAEDLLNVLNDEFSALAFKILPELIALTGNEQVKKEFEGWDFEYSSGSRQAALFHSWFSRILNIISQKLPKLSENPVFRSMVAKTIEKKDFQNLCRVLEVDCTPSLLKKCFHEASEDVRQRTWGELHMVHFSHFPFRHSFQWLFGFEVPSSGSDSTVSFQSSTSNGESSVQARFISDQGNHSQSLWGIRIGQSGNPFSPHYKDQLFSFPSTLQEIPSF